MRLHGSVFIGTLLALGLLSHGIVLVQLSHHPERGHRGPAESFRAGQLVDPESDAFRLTAAGGFEPVDSRVW